jgi:hypothetical protein
VSPALERLSPLLPSPDDARSDLRRELLRPEYHQQDVVQQLLSWLDRTLGSLLDATAQAPAVSTLLALVVLVALLLGLGTLLSRARRTARATTPSAVVLGEEGLDAASLRRRAEEALAAGHWPQVVVEAFRALTVSQVERGVLADTPGSTALEVARDLAAAHPGHAADVRAAAALFDQVLYGHRPATERGARAVLDLDDALAGRRVTAR